MIVYKIFGQRSNWNQLSIVSIVTPRPEIIIDINFV